MKHIIDVAGMEAYSKCKLMEVVWRLPGEMENCNQTSDQ